jgi:L-iditol 2-dehydrogenase
MNRTGTTLEAPRALGPIPKTMRAGVYREKGIVRVEEVPVPEVADGEVLIKVAACGICGTDIKKIYHATSPRSQIRPRTRRHRRRRRPRPRQMETRRPRHELSSIPCGKCSTANAAFSQCKQYKTTGLTAGFTPNGGGFAEYVKAMPCVAERGIVALPDNVRSKKPLSSNPSTPSSKPSSSRNGRRNRPEVIGCGPIGLQLLMVANLEGAKLYTSDPMAVRRAKSLTLGALESFDPSSGKLVEELKARTDGRGADAVLVAVAHPSVVVDALAAARPGGRVLLFAANDPVTRIEFPASAVGIDEKEILGSYSAAVDIQQAAADLVLNKKLPIMEIVTHRFPLARIQEGLDLAVKPTAESLKILVTHA